MRFNKVKLLLFVLIAGIIVCELAGYSTAATTPVKKLLSLQCSAKQLAVYQGEKTSLAKSLKVTGVYSTGPKKDVTSQVKFSSLNPDIASIDGGVITGINPGSASLAISFGGIKTSIKLQVKAVPTVIIPGTMGSTLIDTDTNETIWLGFTRNLLEKLILPPNGELPELGLRGSGIRPGYIFDRDLISSQYNYYGAIEYALKGSTFKQVETFPYDWRLDIDRNAEKLGEALKTLAKKYNTDKVNIIAHSQGGLIVKRFIQRSMFRNIKPGNVNPGNVKIGKFIAIAVPQYGAPAMFYIWLTGKLDQQQSSVFDAILDKDTVRRILQNSPSSYEMFPGSSYFSSYKEKGIDASYFSTVDNLGEKHVYDYNSMIDWLNNEPLVNRDLLEKAVDIHEGIYGMDSFDLLSDAARKYADTYIIAGTGINTISMCTSSGNKKSFKYGRSGDGTVPLLSATGGRLVHNKIRYVKNVGHGSMVKNNSVINQILNVLENKPEDAAGILKDPGPVK